MDFERFRIMGPEQADLVRELIEYREDRHSPFMPFVHLWMGFNGWMASVTGKEKDFEMINMVAGNSRLSEAFDRLMSEDVHFQGIVDEFAESWPVVNVSDLRRKLGQQISWDLDRYTLLRICVERGVKMHPSPWVPGARPNWDKTLRVIYQIRCNLFHGTKSPHNFQDRVLVAGADRVLRYFLRRTNLLNWGNRMSDFEFMS